MKASIFSSIIESVRDYTPTTLTIEAEGKKYNRRFIPEDRLIILGGGHVSQAVSKIAAMMDFDIIVVDDRPAFANTERFPEAKEVICDGFVNALDRLQIRATDYVCVMTRGHRHDALCVRHIMSGTMPYYIGMMGSHGRVADFRDVLRDEGYPEERISALVAPIGLEINAKTHYEIALSVVGQLVEARRSPNRPEDQDCVDLKNADYSVLEALADTTEPKAFVMVLRSTGSVPAKPGAMMSVDSIGGIKGTVGGGCSEAGIITKARRVIATGGSAIVEVNMTNDVAEENGMVCGGRMWAYIEAVTE